MELTFEALSKLGIFELRHLGRTLGVPSPTSRSKGDLINAILAGEKQPEGKKLGRRPKALATLVHDAPEVKTAEPEAEIIMPTRRAPAPAVTKPAVSAEPAAEESTYSTWKARPNSYTPSPKPYESKPYESKPYERKPYEGKPYEGKPYEGRSYENKPYESKPYERKPYENRYEGASKYGERENGYENRNERRDWRTPDTEAKPERREWRTPDTDAKPYENRYSEGNKYGERPRNDWRQAETRSYDAAGPADDEAPEPREGILEICQDGYGFLRSKNCGQGEGDAYVSSKEIRRNSLRRGDYVTALTKKLADNRPPSVVEVLTINGKKADAAFSRKYFDDLTPIYPDSRLRLELPASKMDIAIRSIDLVAPIGKGQRAMIVSPPKAGKTTLLKKIANSISTNYPDVHLIMLLVDERPEEVTDMQRSVKGDVVYSTFDETPENHIKAAEMVLERAKRLVEVGRDVVILLDSLTRLARAYNLTVPSSGKTLSGGLDPIALNSPKKFFGAARNIEKGGSLTIIASALIDTGSRLDDVIYEEFKGTGNMEIHLDRSLSEKRIFPAIDLNRSGTRHENLLLDQKELEGIWAVRKMLAGSGNQDAAENLISMMLRTASNKEFIEQLTQQLIKLQKEGYNFSK